MNNRKGEKGIFIYFSESYPISLSPSKKHLVLFKCLKGNTRTGASLFAGVKEWAANRLNSDMSRSAKAKVESRNNQNMETGFKSQTEPQINTDSTRENKKLQ